MTLRLENVLGTGQWIRAIKKGNPPWGAEPCDFHIKLKDIRKVHFSDIDEAERAKGIDSTSDLWVLNLSVRNALKNHIYCYELVRNLNFTTPSGTKVINVNDPWITRFSDFSRTNRLRSLASGSLPPKVIRSGAIILLLNTSPDNLTLEFSEGDIFIDQ